MRTSGLAVAAVLSIAACGAWAQGQEPMKTPAPAPGAAGPYHVLKTFAVGGEGGWDYVTIDPEAGRLYIPRSTRVMVLDAGTGETVGTVDDTAGVHGVALAPALGRGFSSNGRANTVTAFDLKTLKPLGTVKTGTNPDAILFEPVTHQVFAFNGRSKDATVFDATTLEVTGTIALGGKPEFAAEDGKGHVYVNIEDTSEVACLDAAKRTVDRRWPLAPGTGPSGLAIDPEHHRLFSVCGNETMVVSDADTGKVIGTAKIGKGVDGAGFDPKGGFALASNGEGTLTVVSTESGKPFEVAQTLPTARGARTMVVDPRTGTIYLPTAEFEAPKEGATGRPPMKPGTFKILVVGH